MRTALVTGAHGVIGAGLVAHLRSLPDWDVITVARTRADITVDLLDAAAARDALGGTGATHVFHAAYQDRPTWRELVAPNLAMLVNTVEAVESPALRHVSLMQGYKVYGAHLGPFRTPAREDDAGHMPPEFNLDQQAFLESRSGAWTWSAMRPSVVCSTALGNPMNLVAALAVYATISKELGVPLRFPGKPGAYDSLLEVTDAGLLAHATVWAATTPECADQAFNVANGDLFRWSRLWPRIAAEFEVPLGDPLPMSLADVMSDKEPVWDRIVAAHGLRPTPYADVSSWAFADAVFSWDYDFLADGSRARRLGFTEFVDTEAMFAGLFDRLRAERVIPGTATGARRASA
ncbi:SDR family oxidoreductase [Actinokineospora bangkokensis]|uniref:NAD-dependent dehydratase n=1 Tax=Actinokineospora bangkokensis TaxID=1193682 RepID=A0A1Q9LLF1_9PSEU|nr:SDR family oxidoreductase [Actinokineospora bangkokensis]OLR92850.1 NAD-dependent dehydratase [Actinokineospora bangkokensis]